MMVPSAKPSPDGKKTGTGRQAGAGIWSSDRVTSIGSRCKPLEGLTRILETCAISHLKETLATVVGSLHSRPVLTSALVQ